MRGGGVRRTGFPFVAFVATTPFVVTTFSIVTTRFVVTTFSVVTTFRRYVAAKEFCRSRILRDAGWKEWKGRT
jgi:hypothetical protein